MTKKIKVSTHDYDTKDIDVYLDGNILHINIGSDRNQVDLSNILPTIPEIPEIPEPIDYHISSDSRFDPTTKKLILVAKADGHPDKTTEIPFDTLFGLIPTIQGAKGLKGDKGDKGDNGQDGTNGTDGKSAYQIWLDLGNTGSELDFINSLKGEKGDDGQDGENGKAGIDGLSAYQIWLNEGNQGTKQDFLNSLKAEGETKIEYTDAFGDPVLNAF